MVLSETIEVGERFSTSIASFRIPTGVGSLVFSRINEVCKTSFANTASLEIPVGVHSVELRKIIGVGWRYATDIARMEIPLDVNWLELFLMIIHSDGGFAANFRSRQILRGADTLLFRR